MRKPKKYDNEIRTKFRKFMYRVATRLVDIVHNKYYPHNSTPEMNKVAQAVITLMYIFRIRYRNVYHSVHNSIIHRKRFLEFCRRFYEQEKLPYFFNFLLNLSMKFEMFLYLREEGYNFFGAFACMVGEDPRYFYFEAKGGARKLAETADFFLEKAKDLQVLVRLEDPVSEELLSLEDQIDDISIDDLDVSDYDSLILLQDIDRCLYSGLQKYADQKVLPFIILRFILQGRVPDTPANKYKKKISIEKYFNRCLIREILNGEAFENINTAEKFIIFMNENSKSQDNPDEVFNREQRRNRRKKSNENCQSSSKETGPSSEDKNYGHGLEWLRGFDAKTSSLLSDGNSKNPSDNLRSAENSSSRKKVDPLHETATGTVSSVKYNVSAKRKETSSNHAGTERKKLDPLGETASGTASSVKHNVGMKRRESSANHTSSKEENKNLPGKSSKLSKAKSHGSNKHKGKKETIKVEETKHTASQDTFDETNPLGKLKETLISVIKRTGALHCWEKRIIICLINEAKVFSEQEIDTLSEKINSIPDKDYINPGEEGDLKQFFEIIKMEDKCDSLYLENDNHFSGKLPCPEQKEIITENFTEIMICILAMCSENLLQVEVLGHWIPVLQDVLLKNRELTRAFIRYGLNSLLPFLSTHAPTICR